MNTLVSAARVSLEPLDSHFIASGDAAFKDDYLTLLAALLLENGALNDAQQRLLLLLLPSIGPAFPLPHYLQQAGKLDAVALTHVVQSVRLAAPCRAAHPSSCGKTFLAGKINGGDGRANFAD